MKKLPAIEWKFTVSDAELEACTVYEYGRSATWFHAGLLNEIRFYRRQEAAPGETPPPILLLFKPFSRMVKGGHLFQWGDKAYREHIDYFPGTPWAKLPPAIRRNMVALYSDAELPLDFEKFDRYLSSTSFSYQGQNMLREWDKCAREEAAREDAWNERHGNQGPLDSLIRGASGLPVDVVTADWLKMNALRPSHIADSLSHYSGQTPPAGMTAEILKFNWNVDDKRLLERIAQLLPQLRPASHKHRAGHNRKDAPLQVGNRHITWRNALDALGVWRLKQAYPWPSAYSRYYEGQPVYLDALRKAPDNWQTVTKGLRRAKKLADDLLEKWFPEPVDKT